MNIEIWYDAVAQETDTVVNGVTVEKNDVYGFLYPVRSYPIQSWLFPNGSWKGLERQLTDLARDEAVRLMFHGRSCDYEDVRKCLAGSLGVELSFSEWDVCSRYDQLFSELIMAIKNNDSVIRSLISALGYEFSYDIELDLPEIELPWECNIYDVTDLHDATEKIEKCCCYVHSEYFSSYESLRELLALTRSLRLPADAIYCCFNDESVRSEYEYYADSFKRMGFNFCMEGSDYTERARIKYVLPCVVKNKIEKCGAMLKKLCDAYLEMKNSSTSEFGRLKKNIVNLGSEEKGRYLNIKQLRDNSDRFRYGMERIYEYIAVLFSVSKDNKDEVLHYECIDKLSENIKLYLKSETK